jgi:LysR family transcriptional regulator (chromosome initiation inhibitor)
MSLLDKRIEAFFQIAQSGTVLSAAKRLGYTQTAMTQRIRSLEAELGTTLFTRSRRGMRLTPEGIALLQYCKGAEELEGAVFSSISPKSQKSENHVTLAAPTSAMSFHFVKLGGEVMKKNPGLFMHMLIDDQLNRVDLVRTGRAQLAIVPPDQVPNEMDSKKLQPNRYILVCTSAWSKRKLDDVLENEKIIDFYETDPTTLNYLRKSDLLSHIRKPRLFVNHNLAMIELILAGVGFGTLTREVAKPYLDSGELIQLGQSRVLEEPLALIWYPRPQMPKYFKAVLDAIR